MRMRVLDVKIIRDLCCLHVSNTLDRISHATLKTWVLWHGAVLNSFHPNKSLVALWNITYKHGAALVAACLSRRSAQRFELPVTNDHEMQSTGCKQQPASVWSSYGATCTNNLYVVFKRLRWRFTVQSPGHSDKRIKVMKLPVSQLIYFIRQKKWPILDHRGT